ncbi:MAG: hypothetical protein FJY83_04995 [Candidatus Aminicenantes bacterium]|nr:hypothetical protein [Candidatus Aminicenantes bacterium]
MMTSRERLLAALERKVPDRLPVTTHHVQESFLRRRLEGLSVQAFFDRFGLDPILWLDAHKPDIRNGAYFYPGRSASGPGAGPGLDEPRILLSDSWQLRKTHLPDHRSVRYEFLTPRRSLSLVMRTDENTAWVSERLIKEKSDIDLIAAYAPAPLCDAEAVNREAELFAGRGLVRGTVPGFDVAGQPGCWQDAAVLYGIENLILAAYDDPDWLRAFLGILLERKKPYVRSLHGAKFDLVELGGGDASSTVISPRIFEEFVAPFDAELIRLAHEAGQRIVYHTCGGMMPLLEIIAALGVDAMETFTPASMGGDADLGEAKRRVGDRVCLIGGFDQFHHFLGCAPEDTRRAVRRCFEAAGPGGGYILAPSDHFFDADPELLEAYADEAGKCVYGRSAGP